MRSVHEAIESAVRAGTTQADIAARAGISDAHLSNYLSGRRGMSTTALRRLVAVFAGHGVTIEATCDEHDRRRVA